MLFNNIITKQMNAKLLLPYAVILFFTASLYQCSRLQDKQETVKCENEPNQTASINLLTSPSNSLQDSVNTLTN